VQKCTLRVCKNVHSHILITSINNIIDSKQVCNIILKELKNAKEIS